MTALEKVKLEHPEIPEKECTRLTGRYCPSDFGYIADPETCFETGCEDCWSREIPETNLVIGDSEVEHPDTDIPEKSTVNIEPDGNVEIKVENDTIESVFTKTPDNDMKLNVRSKTIYAHIGPFEGHPDPVGEPGEPGVPVILDSGNRRQFESGAVRDIQEGKGRCDLLPLDITAQLMNDSVLLSISLFQYEGTVGHLFAALDDFAAHWDDNLTKGERDIIIQRHSTMFLEVSKHFEEGAKKYGENNWQKGIPVHCYIDSAVRHYLKFLRGDKDEPHDRAFCWNIMCAIWTCKHKPELNEYDQRSEFLRDAKKKLCEIISTGIIPSSELSITKDLNVPQRDYDPVARAYDIAKTAYNGDHSNIAYALEEIVGYLGEALE